MRLAVTCIVLCLAGLAASQSIEPPTYDELLAEVRSLRVEKDKLRRANVRLQARVAELEAKVAELQPAEPDDVEPADGAGEERPLSVRDAIEQGVVVPGMSVGQVRRAVGDKGLSTSPLKADRRQWRFVVRGEETYENESGIVAIWLVNIYRGQVVNAERFEPGAELVLPWPKKLPENFNSE